MKVHFGEVRHFKQCYGTPPEGQFALDAEPPKSPHWDHCREQFASKFTEELTGFFFSHPLHKSEDVAHFLVKFENITGIQALRSPYSFSTFSKTTKDSILWVEPTKFWLECPLRRSLLTIVLRCGINYSISKDNFDEALLSEDFKETLYVRETKSAVLRFLFGFTRFTGTIASQPTSSVHKHGWREEFQKLDDVTIRRRLILPEGEPKETSIIGIESLWA